MNTPASKIRSAAMGLVEVSGLAAGPYSIVAPITGMPCYYYRTMAWQWKREGKNSKWVKVADESYHVPFFLEDNTGRVLVNPQGAEMEIHRDFHDEFSQSLFSSRLEIPSNVTGFLIRHGVTGDTTIKVEEYCIKPKNSLFVLGTLAENPGLTVSATPVRSLTSDKKSMSFALPLSLSFNSSSIDASGSSSFTAYSNGPVQPSGTTTAHHLDPEQQAKLAAVLTKAGIMSPMAWAAAGIDSAAQATAHPTANGAAAAAAPAPEQFDLHPSVVLMRGAHNPTFFISWRSQREVVKSLGWKSALMIWAGPALTLLCIYILASQYGGL